MAISSGAGTVFGWFANMTAVAGLMTWFGICVTYIRFYEGLKVQGFDRTTLPYYTRLQPYAAWYGAIATFVICLVCLAYYYPPLRNTVLMLFQFNGWSVFLKGNWNTATFVTSYLPLIMFPILYIGAMFYYRSPPVKAEDMDFVSDIAQIEADEVPDSPPKNKMEAFWNWLVSFAVLWTFAINVLYIYLSRCEMSKGNVFTSRHPVSRCIPIMFAHTTLVLYM